jgi:hypothetical protein
LVKYTYFGDTDLSGTVDGGDYTKTDTGFDVGLSGWNNGDFNYDNKVDGSDYTLIDNAFNGGGGSLAAATPAATVATEVVADASPVTPTAVTAAQAAKVHAPVAPPAVSTASPFGSTAIPPCIDDVVDLGGSKRLYRFGR